MGQLFSFVSTLIQSIFLKYTCTLYVNWQGFEASLGSFTFSRIMQMHEGCTNYRGIWHETLYSLPSCLGPSHGAFEDTHTCLLAAHIHVRMHTPKYDVCIFDLCVGCIYYQGGSVVRAPCRRRKLENYEFPGKSLERVKALLYMRQVGGWIGAMLVFFFFPERCILTTC